MWDLHGDNSYLNGKDYTKPLGGLDPDKVLDLTPSTVCVVFNQKHIKKCALYDHQMDNWDTDYTVKSIADDALDRNAAVMVFHTMTQFYNDPQGGKRFTPADFKKFVVAIRRY